MFRSRDGIQIFSLDLVSDLFIGQHYCPSGHGDSVYFSSSVCLSVQLVGTCYGLSVRGLGLVVVLL